MMLQRFKLIDHTRYQLKIKESLTIKPDGLKIKVRPRTDRGVGKLRGRSWSPPGPPAAPQPARRAAVKGEGRLLTVLYGTSLGTCRDIADQIADRAGASGFEVTARPLDDCADGLPESGTLVVVTSTYNGSAPDSATKMEAAIREKRIGEVERPNLTYAVLGCRQHAVEDLPGLPQADGKHAAPDRRQERAAARRGRRQRRFRRRRRALDGRSSGQALGEGGGPAKPAAAAPKLKIAFSDEHATRAACCRTPPTGCR